MSFLTNCKVPGLKRICKSRKITNYSKLKKKDLLDAIVRDKSVKFLQRFWRKTLMGNAICPITLEKLNWTDPCFGFKTNAGIWIYYDLHSIMQSVHHGIFSCPYTREPFTRKHMHAMDQLAKMHKIKYRSVVKQFESPRAAERRRRTEAHQEDILILQRCLDDIHTQVRSYVEDIEAPTTHIGTHSFVLNAILFPQFSQLFRQLIRNDRNIARQTLDNCISTIRGSSRQPVNDIRNLKDTSLTFYYSLNQLF